MKAFPAGLPLLVVTSAVLVLSIDIPHGVTWPDSTPLPSAAPPSGTRDRQTNTSSIADDIHTSDQTNNSSSSSSDIGGKVAVGVVVPLVVLGVGLGLTYYCYRKRFPVRMVMGRNFGKFSNPNYARPARTHSLIRPDADTVFQQMQPTNASSVNLVISDDECDQPSQYVNNAFVFDSEDADEEEVERRFRQHKAYLFKGAHGNDGDKTSEGAGNHDSTDGPAVYKNVDETEAAREEHSDPSAEYQDGNVDAHANVKVIDEELSARKIHEQHRGRGLQHETATSNSDECDAASVEKSSKTSNEDYDKESLSENAVSDTSSRSASISRPPVRTPEQEVVAENNASLSAASFPQVGKTYVYNSSMTVKEFLEMQKQGPLGEVLYERNSRSGSLVTRSGAQTLVKRRAQSADNLISADNPLPEPYAWSNRETSQSLTSLDPEHPEDSLDEAGQAMKSSIFHTYQNLSVLPYDQDKDKEGHDISDTIVYPYTDGLSEDSSEFAESFLASRSESEETQHSLGFTEGDASQAPPEDGGTDRSDTPSFELGEHTENNQEGYFQLLEDTSENVLPSETEAGDIQVVPQAEVGQSFEAAETSSFLPDPLDDVITTTGSAPVFFLSEDDGDFGNGKSERDEDDTELSSAGTESVSSTEDPSGISDLNHDQKNDSDAPSEINPVASDPTTSTENLEDKEREITPAGTTETENGAEGEFSPSSDDSPPHAENQAAPTLPEPPAHAPLARIWRQDPPSKLHLIPGLTFSDLSSDEYSSPSESSEESEDDDENNTEGTLPDLADLTSPPLQLGQFTETEVISTDSVLPPPESSKSHVVGSGHVPYEPTQDLGFRKPVGLAALRSLQASYHDVEERADSDSKREFGKLTFSETDSALDSAGQYAIDSAHAQQQIVDKSDSGGRAFVFSNDYPDDIDV